MCMEYCWYNSGTKPSAKQEKTHLFQHICTEFEYVTFPYDILDSDVLNLSYWCLSEALSDVLYVCNSCLCCFGWRNQVWEDRTQFWALHFIFQ